MSSDFAFLAMLARGPIDAVLGEAATLHPTERAKGPHGARTPSSTRPAAPIVAVFFQDTEFAARQRARPLIGQTSDRMLNRSPDVLCSTAFAGDIAVSDKLLRDGTGEMFEIVTIDPDGVGDRILGLSHVKG